METFDYIVVGAGTAGCLLANRLSADPSIRVLLIEAGGRDDYVWIHVPVGYLYCIGNPRTDWLYATEAEAGLNGRSIRYPRGKVLGGCSSINGMIYMRGQRRDYEQWVALGCPGWSWDEVLPYFVRHEDYHRLDGGGNDPLHGHGGEWRIESPRVRWDLLDAFRQAAAEVGIPPVDDFNRGDNFGCGYFEVNQRRGVRWNASKAFLHPVRTRPNLKVVTHCQVTRLRFRDDGSGRVDGVEFRQLERRFGAARGPGPSGGGRSAGAGGTAATGGAVGAGAAGRSVFAGEPEYARASHEVVMAAGAVGTPQILELSGLGRGTLLQALGIPVRADLPGVGENLQDHLQLRTVYKVSGVRTLNQQANSLVGKAGMALQYLLFRRGPMTMSPSQLGAFARSDPGQITPNVEYHVQPLSLDKFGDPLHRFPAFTASVCNLRPTSRGSIHIASPDPAEPPRIAPGYLSTEDDRQVAADSIRLTRRIVAAEALRRFAPVEHLPGPHLQSDEELAAAAGAVGTTIFHPVGTCRMGPSAEPGAVVDARLRCHRVPGLRIADASIMPTITSGNTNSPTLMIAERAAEMILADRRR